MSKTKCFSYESIQERTWRRLANEAKKNGRSLSAQLMFILEDFFERKRLLNRIQNQPTTMEGNHAKSTDAS